MKHVKPKKCPTGPMRVDVENFLREFSHRTVEKFLKGRKDHGYDDLSKLDYDSEIMGELMDLIIYNWLRKKYEIQNKNVGNRAVCGVCKGKVPKKRVHKRGFVSGRQRRGAYWEHR